VLQKRRPSVTEFKEKFSEHGFEQSRLSVGLTPDESRVTAKTVPTLQGNEDDPFERDGTQAFEYIAAIVRVSPLFPSLELSPFVTISQSLASLSSLYCYQGLSSPWQYSHSSKTPSRGLIPTQAKSGYITDHFCDLLFGATRFPVLFPSIVSSEIPPCTASGVKGLHLHDSERELRSMEEQKKDQTALPTHKRRRPSIPSLPAGNLEPKWSRRTSSSTAPDDLAAGGRVLLPSVANTFDQQKAVGGDAWRGDDRMSQLVDLERQFTSIK
jgi:hypothetical protein